MTDLLQINGNELTNPLAPATPKTTTICPAAQLHTKRATTATATKSTKSNQAPSQPNSNHKRPSTVDTNAHKRLKCSTLPGSYLDKNMSPAKCFDHGKTEAARKHAPPTTPAKHEQNTLLQHLMAPTPRTRKCNEMGSHRGNGTTANAMQQRWNGSDGDGQQNAMYQHLQQGNEMDKSNGCQSSNSVLKNLLVSGCDLSAGYICAAPIRAKKTAKA